MLAFPSSIRIFLAVEPVDMRKQHNGLWAEAQNYLNEDPFKGALFVFSNKRRNRLKILFWDGGGTWIFSKRLEEGRFSWPRGSDDQKLVLTPEALSMLVGGIDLKNGCKKAWYER